VKYNKEKVDKETADADVMAVVVDLEDVVVEMVAEVAEVAAEEEEEVEEEEDLLKNGTQPLNLVDWSKLEKLNP